MRFWAAGLMGVLLAASWGCSDRLADIQAQLEGTWVLESRALPDGTRLASPRISGAFTWVPIDSRKAHVTLNVLVDEQDQLPRTFDYASSTYEVSTSAITRKRYLMLRQGYRSSSRAPLTGYTKARTAKGKISVEEGTIKISHERGFSQVFLEDRMTATFPGVFVDTWKKVR